MDPVPDPGKGTLVDSYLFPYPVKRAGSGWIRIWIQNADFIGMLHNNIVI